MRIVSSWLKDVTVAQSLIGQDLSAELLMNE